MTRILFVGQKPEIVDFTDSALPPGFNAEKINAGIGVAAPAAAIAFDTRPTPPPVSFRPADPRPGPGSP